MSRPIKLSDNIITKLVASITDELKQHKVFESKLDLSFRVPDVEESRANLVFEPMAFAKMLSLVNNFDSEVAWHGTATRDGNTYTITDILVYPQEVSGATVNTDQEEYETWLYELEDEQFNNLRFQGHSHVNMGTSPSSVDLSHQERIVDQLEDDMFYIFAIWNKKMERTIKIFDLASNTLYETKDVDVFIGDSAYDEKAFISDAKDMVKATSYYAYSKPKKSKSKTQTSGYDYAWANKLYDEFI